MGWPHLPPWKHLEWAAALRCRAVPVAELPPWFLDPRNLTRQDMGVDLLGLDDSVAVQCKCYNGTVGIKDISHFICMAQYCYRAAKLILVTTPSSRLTGEAYKLLSTASVKHVVLGDADVERLVESARTTRLQAGQISTEPVERPPLRPCQERCIRACAEGARVIEMACGTGKTRVMRELADQVCGRVLVLVPTRVLLRQHMALFPEFCPVGMGHNSKIVWDAPGYISVYNSANLLANLSFAHLYMDEGHHPLPSGCPEAQETFLFSATHRGQPDFRYRLDEAIEDGVLRDYDLTVPVVDRGDAFGNLADLLNQSNGRFRRVLAYCNSIKEARRFHDEVQKCGLASWHINGNTPEAASIGGCDDHMFCGHGHHCDNHDEDEGEDDDADADDDEDDP